MPIHFFLFLSHRLPVCLSPSLSVFLCPCLSVSVSFTYTAADHPLLLSSSPPFSSTLPFPFHLISFPLPLPFSSSLFPPFSSPFFFSSLLFPSLLFFPSPLLSPSFFSLSFLSSSYLSPLNSSLAFPTPDTPAIPSFLLLCFSQVLSHLTSVPLTRTFLHPTVCRDFTTLITSAANILTPGFPAIYPNNRECVWKIIAPKNSRIKFKFLEFKVKKCRDELPCSCDFVEFRDGNSSTAELIGRFCGDTVPQDLYSSNRYLFVRFKSDDKTGAKGFSASVSSTRMTSKYGRCFVWLGECTLCLEVFRPVANDGTA